MRAKSDRATSASPIAADLPPVMEPAAEQETEKEAAQRKAEHEQRMAEYEAEQQHREEERRAEYERQQKEYEPEQAREKRRKARLAIFERIIENARASFNAAQMRFLLRLLIQLDYASLRTLPPISPMGTSSLCHLEKKHCEETL